MPRDIHFPPEEIERVAEENDAGLRAYVPTDEGDAIYTRLAISISSAFLRWELDEVSRGTSVNSIVMAVERMFGWMLADVLYNAELSVGERMEWARTISKAICEIAIYQLAHGKVESTAHSVRGGHA